MIRSAVPDAVDPAVELVRLQGRKARLIACLGWQVMRRSTGKADSRAAQPILLAKLG